MSAAGGQQAGSRRAGGRDELGAKWARRPPAAPPLGGARALIRWRQPRSFRNLGAYNEMGTPADSARLCTRSHTNSLALTQTQHTWFTRQSSSRSRTSPGRWGLRTGSRPLRRGRGVERRHNRYVQAWHGRAAAAAWRELPLGPLPAWSSAAAQPLRGPTNEGVAVVQAHAKHVQEALRWPGGREEPGL